MNTTRTRATAAIVVGLLALGACGGDDDSNDDAAGVDMEQSAAEETGGDTGDSGSSGDSDSSGGSAPSGDGVASLMLSVDGGPGSGTHNATAPDAGCSRHPLGEGTFGVQYSLLDREGFHSFQLEIDDAEAAATGNSAFAATAYVDENRYHLDRGATGAMLTLEDEGDTATITILGTTDEGVDVSAVVECHQVIDLG